MTHRDHSGEGAVDLDGAPAVVAGPHPLIFGEATHPLVAVSAVCVRTRRRDILDGGRYPLRRHRHPMGERPMP